MPQTWRALRKARRRRWHGSGKALTAIAPAITPVIDDGQIDMHRTLRKFKRVTANTY